MLHIDLNPHDMAEVTRILGLHVPELEVWAFGSRVKWTAKAHSDLDLALITNSPLPLERFAELREAFDESQLPIRVDLVDWARTSESFREIIRQQKFVLKPEPKENEEHIHWPVKTLESALEALIDYRGKTPEKTTSGIPLVTAKVIKNGRIEKPNEFIATGNYDVWMRRGIPKAGDVVLTTEAPLGEVAQLGNEKVALAQRVITLRGKPGILDNGYLLYLLQTEEMQEQLKSRSTGTTVLGIKQSELRKITIRIPPIDLQRNAATTLRVLDDRITLLHETNATLEAIAQAIFKSWFVDFEPVSAKQAGRVPEGINDATAALFPESFQNSELGSFPMGWNRLSFTDTVHVIGGGTPKTSVAGYWNGDIPWFSVVDAPTISDVFVVDTNKHITEEGLKHSSTSLLSEGTTIISARGTVGRLAIVGREMAMNQSCYGLRGVAGDSYFTYFSTYRLVESLKRRSHGSVFDTITTETMKGVHVIYPKKPLIDAFEDVIGPFMCRIKENLFQAHTLAILRDAILPRLISGQLRLTGTASKSAAPHLTK